MSVDMYSQEDSMIRSELKVWRNLSPLQGTFVENFNVSKIRTSFAFLSKNAEGETEKGRKIVNANV